MIATLLFSLFQVCFGKIRAKKYHPWIQNSRLRRNRTRLFTYVLRTDEKLIVYSDLCVSFIFHWTEMTNGHYAHCIIWWWKSNGTRFQDFRSISIRGGVKSNRTNIELIFIEFLELFFTFESIESQIFALKEFRTNLSSEKFDSTL